MNRKGALLPQDEDLDRTDKLPVLGPEVAGYAGQDDPLESTGTWVQVEVETAGLRQEVEQRDAAIAELTTLLRQKSFALSRAEKDLEQVRAELMRSSQATGKDAADLERRLRELEREYVNVSALHDERRVAIARLEDALSDAREREHQLETTIAELAAGQQATAASHQQDLARLAEAEHRLAEATRESLGDAARQEQQRLEERIGTLQAELDAARAEMTGLKDALAWQYDQVTELKDSLAERDARIDSLLERLRSREARRRYAADIRRAAGSGPDRDLMQQRIMELEAELAAVPRPDSPTGEALAGPDDPTIAGNDRRGLLLRISELSAGIDRRDDRIAMLESELQAAGRAPEAADAGATAQSGEDLLPARYLVRLDGGAKAVHELTGQKISIGRTPDNDLQIRESHISRVHAFLRLGPEATVLEDAASRNGVFVNDRRIRRELLKDGDTVILGKSRFRFQLERPGKH